MSKRRPRAMWEGTGTGTLKGTVVTIIKWTQGILGFFWGIRNTTLAGGEKRGEPGASVPVQHWHQGIF